MVNNTILTDYEISHKNNHDLCISRQVTVYDIVVISIIFLIISLT